MKNFIQKRIMSMVAGYLMGLIIIIPAYLVFESQSPDSWWIHIDKMEALDYENQVGKPLIFSTIIEVERDAVEIDWRHSLWCRGLGTEDPLRAWSTYEGRSYDLPITTIRTEFTYLVGNRYDPTGQPQYPAECELRAKISATTPFIKQNKSSATTSPRFIIK